MKLMPRSEALFFLFTSSVSLFGSTGLAEKSADPVTQIPYTWRNVTIGGGGAVTGITTRKGTSTFYIRTDVGGAYRWNVDSQSWIPLNDGLSEKQKNWYGIESIAMDPGDATGQTVYIAVGKYATDWAQPVHGDILKSQDGGRHWTPAGLTLHNASNWDQRFGERLAVDPNDSRIVVYASRGDGFWRSTAAGETGSWKRIMTAPTGPIALPRNRNPSGLTFAVFDKTSAQPEQRSQVLYVGAWDTGVYQSWDGGDSWKLLDGGPIQPYRAAVSDNGTLFVTHARGLSRYRDGMWTEIAPQLGQRFQAIAVDPTDPSHVLTARLEWKGGNTIYRSLDSGNSWSLLSKRGLQQLSWQSSYNFASAIESIAFDPMVPKAALFTDWFNVWHTPDITADKTEWTNLYAGHEELVTVGGLISTPTGAPLHSGVADLDGFTHDSLEAPPTRRMSAVGFPNNHTSTSIDFAETKSAFIVRVGRFFWDGPGTGGFSNNGGQTWTPFPVTPGAGGRTAVSASGDRIVWLPQGQAPFFSKDLGTTWFQSSGAPQGAIPGTTIFDSYKQPLAADRVNSEVFYLYKSGQFYHSMDGAETWMNVSTLPDSGAWQTIQAAPHMSGEVWAGLDWQGLYRSGDFGLTFTKVPNVQRALLFAFGKAAPGKSNPATFVFGRVNDVDGIFRSDDLGATWTSIGDPKMPIGNEPNTMAGDRQVHGRVYIGTNGRGIFYGQPSGAQVSEN